MLFHVRMKVNIPLNLDPVFVAETKKKEKELSQQLQREGKWKHIWRVAGLYENVSIFDVKDAEELHNIMMSLPLYPYMDVEVAALCTHPSAI